MRRYLPVIKMFWTTARLPSVDDLVPRTYARRSFHLRTTPNAFTSWFRSFYRLAARLLLTRVGLLPHVPLPTCNAYCVPCPLTRYTGWADLDLRHRATCLRVCSGVRYIYRTPPTTTTNWIWPIRTFTGRVAPLPVLLPFYHHLRFFSYY